MFQPFYHGHIRKLIVAFGSLFDDIKISSVDSSGTIRNVSTVPLRYAGSDKSLFADDPDMKPYNEIYPRMSFEITSIGYDANKKLNQNNVLNGLSAPTPYLVDIGLYILSRNMNDSLQIIEQILPYFNPTLTLSMENSPSIGKIQDVPITLTAVSIQDDYEGEEDKARRVEWSLNFSCLLDFYKNTNDDYENQLISFIEKKYDPSNPNSCTPPRKRKVIKNKNRIEKIIINEFIDVFNEENYVNVPLMSENTSSFVRDVLLPAEINSSQNNQNSSSGNYTVFNQSNAEEIWYIQHDTGKLPIVAVYDSTGVQIEPLVRSVNNNNAIEIVNNTPQIGFAVLKW